MKRSELYSFIENLQKANNYFIPSYCTELCNFIAKKIIEQNEWIGEKYGVYFISWLIEDEVRKEATDLFYECAEKGVQLLVDSLMDMYFLNELSIPVTKEQYDDSVFNSDVFTMEDVVYSIIYDYGKERVNAFLKCFRPEDTEALESMLCNWKENSKCALPAYDDFK